MNKPTMVPIADIVIDREIRPDDNLTELSESMVSHGQKQPVLLIPYTFDETDYFFLVDGLRRFTVLQQHGVTAIKAIISDNLQDSLAVIEKTRKHGVAARLPVSARRTWEMFNALHGQQEERSRQLRRRQIGIARHERVSEPADRARTIFAAALGFPGDALLTAAMGVYKGVYENTDPDKQAALDEILARLDAGELTTYAARGEIARLGRKEMPGFIVKASEQRDAFTKGLASLSGATKALSYLGEVNPAISKEELALYLKGLEEARRDLQRFITVIKKRVS